ncbi:MAG: class I SAM-dependent methyltransferase [Candidatus Pacebacteria bacterium]|nr:class I SAM-dependent methyltransferase [Candidatus Paceibacterota bacterium]
MEDIDVICDRFIIFFGKYIKEIKNKDYLDEIIKDIKEALALEFGLRKNEGKSDRKAFKLAVMEVFNAYYYLYVTLQANKSDKKFAYYLEALKEIISKYDLTAESIILAPGSGLALLEIFLAKEVFRKSHIICIDLSEEACRESKRIAKDEEADNIDFIIGDVENPPYRNDQVFDICLINGFLAFEKDQSYY